MKTKGQHGPEHCVSLEFARAMVASGGGLIGALEQAESRITALQREREAVVAAVHPVGHQQPFETCDFYVCGEVRRALADHRAAASESAPAGSPPVPAPPPPAPPASPPAH